jgi:UDP-glucose 4-epimerase
MPADEGGPATVRNHDLSSLTGRIHATFDWTPRYDNLDTIAAHALAWEEKLLRERASDSLQAVTA